MPEDYLSNRDRMIEEERAHAEGHPSVLELQQGDVETPAEEVVVVDRDSNASTVLIAHSGAVPVTRRELADYPMPKQLGTRHRPIHHAIMVDRLTQALERAGFKVDSEELAVYRDGGMLFGTMKLSYADGRETFQIGDMGLALGFRNSTNQALSMQMVAGKHVMVCDNLSLCGDTIVMKRKNTSGLDLNAELDVAFAQYKKDNSEFEDIIERAQDRRLSPDEARQIILTQYVVEDPILPLNSMRAVYTNYFEPTAEMTDCFGENLWSLYNAFTREARSLKPARKYEASVRLGRLLERSLAL